MTKRLTFQVVNDRGIWKNDSTFYTYVQLERSVEVQFLVEDWSKDTFRQLKKALDNFSMSQGVNVRCKEILHDRKALNRRCPRAFPFTM